MRTCDKFAFVIAAMLPSMASAQMSGNEGLVRDRTLEALRAADICSYVPNFSIDPGDYGIPLLPEQSIAVDKPKHEVLDVGLEPRNGGYHYTTEIALRCDPSDESFAVKRLGLDPATFRVGGEVKCTANLSNSCQIDGSPECQISGDIGGALDDVANFFDLFKDPLDDFVSGAC